MHGDDPAARPFAERLVAHRGHAQVAPENTLAAVRSALAAGARFVEVDLQLAADGVPWLLHDRTLERMCGVAGSLAERDSAALAALRAGEAARFGRRFADEPLATLDGLVGLLARHPAAHVYVEVKRAALEVFGARRVLDEVLPRLAPLTGRWTLISFDLGVLQLARKVADVALGPVLEAWGQKDEPATAALEPDVIFCDVLRLPADGPLALPAPLVVYEIDRAEQARALFARGVARVESFAVGALLAALEAGPA